MAAHAQGNLWESAHDGHASLWRDGKTTPLRGFSTPFIYRAIEDREGSLWLGTSKTGLFRVTPAVITNYRNTGSPELNVIEAVLEDRDGSIWYGNGLFHLSQARLQSFYYTGAALRPTDAGSAQGWQNIVSAIYQDREGTIWAGTWDGVAHLSGGALVSDGPAAGIRGRVNAIHHDRAGDLWVGGERGLYRIHEAALTHFTVKAAICGFGTAAGLSVRAGAGFSRIAEQGPNTQNITALYEDASGVLWIGTFGVGLYRSSEESWCTTRTRMASLPTVSIQILEDDNGFLWLSGRSGIQRVEKEALNAVASGRRSALAATVFAKAAGMNNGECTSVGQPNGIKARDGKLWFATTEGLAVLDPHAAHVNLLPPPVIIEDALVDGRSIAVGNPVTLHPGQLSLDIRYTALSFIKSGQIRFRYRMGDLDPDWIEASTRRTAYYTRIPPGNYTFHVMAANSDGVWNREGAHLAVSVLPPFYRTWWFEISAVSR